MFEKIKETVAAHLGVDAGVLTEDTDLEEIGADSLDAVELLVAFEEEFGISIPDDDVPAMRTLGDIAEYIADIARI